MGEFSKLETDMSSFIVLSEGAGSFSQQKAIGNGGSGSAFWSVGAKLSFRCSKQEKVEF